MTGKPRRVLLVGMMGAGKSTTGRLLSEVLGWPYVDTDDEVQRRAGRTIAELWEAEGEPAFRSLESSVVSEIASGPQEVVIAVAGGAVLAPESRKVIRDAGLVVWLRADPTTLFARVGEAIGRPLLIKNPGDALHRLAIARAPVYESISDLVFDVDRLSPREVADRIAEALNEQPCVS